MTYTHAHQWQRNSIVLVAACVVVLYMLTVPAVHAQSSWNPTLLVNTEAFQVIDDADTAANISVRFGSTVNESIIWNRTIGMFQFSDDISVLGVLSGTSLRVDRNADINGYLAVTGAILTESNLTLNSDDGATDVVLTFMNSGTDETINWLEAADKFQFSDDVSVVGNLSGSSLRIDGLAEVHGPLAVSGAVRTDSNLTLNDDADANDVVLTFGSNGVSETLTWLNTDDKFRLSDDLDVIGTLSGASIHAGGGNVQIAANGGSVFNINRYPDADFQVDAPATPKLLFADVSTQRVGVLSVTADPEYKFDVWWSGASDWVGKFGGTDASSDAQTRIGLGKIGAFTTGAASQLLINPDGGNVGVGNTAPKATLAVQGIMSGVTLYANRSFSGAGLTDCDVGASSKLLWDATTGRFSCGTDQTGGGSGGNWSNTGSLNAFFDTKYVNVAGDTMTGALTIDLKDTTSGTGLILREKAYFASGAVLSGTLMIQNLQNTATPTQAPAGMLKTYSQTIAAKPFLQNRGQFGSGYALQPALFSKMVMSLTTGGGTTVNGIGTTVTNDTTVSHPTPTETFGYMTNFATAATSNDTAGTSSVNTTFFRGSVGVANGFFFSARVGIVDTTSIREFVGLANQTIATMVTNDNPAGHYVGFQFSTNRGDTTWQFITKDNTTQNVVNTNVTMTANNVYELSFSCTSTCTTVNWQIDNLTTGTRATGSTSSNLPGGSTALRQVLGVSTLTTVAKNIRMQHVYTEADR